MPYKARENGTDWDLLDPNGNVVTSGNAYPVSEADPSVWNNIASHAEANNLVSEAIATVAVGIERV